MGDIGTSSQSNRTVENLQPNKQNLIIVSNRLPLSVKKDGDGKYESSLSSGGLVTSLSGLTKSTTFKWFGWPGLHVEEEADREEVRKSLGAHNAVPVFLDENLANEHYNCFSSMFLVLYYMLWVMMTYSSCRSNPLANPSLPNRLIQ